MGHRINRKRTQSDHQISNRRYRTFDLRLLPEIEQKMPFKTSTLSMNKVILIITMNKQSWKIKAPKI
jgi:hypothetical protein